MADPSFPRSNKSKNDLPSAAWDRLEPLLERFEDAWRRGERPSIEDYLRQAGPTEQRYLLAELVHADLDYRLRTGEAARIEGYLSRFPQLQADNAVALELVLAEYDLRQRRAEILDVADYLRRFPQFADALRQLPAATSALPGTIDGEQTADQRTAAPSMPQELMRHPKFLVLRELGRGGMGVVYQARQTMMNRQVVIKVINRSLLDRPESLERFRREVKAAAQLSHRNIVTAYDAEQAGELHMLVMEFVPGQSLAEVLEKKGPLPVKHACYYMHQAASGLQHAYERGMVHRDIKPQNLMLTPKGQIKILDFGLAKVASERETDKGLTPSGACMGTAEYMAPEQALDARTADTRADLYSLGCSLYCLLAGRPPFREATWMKTILAHRDNVPQPLTELRADVSDRLWRVVERLLAKDPAQRYETPSEVMAALAPFVKPGTKLDAQGASAPASTTSSPGRGTKIAADIDEIKNILREVSSKTPPKALPAKEEAASPFADLTNTGDSSKKIVRASQRAKPLLAGRWKHLGVLAAAVIVTLALILMAVIIKIKTPEGTIVIEVNEPNPYVYVDGEEVTVSWHNGGKKAEIRVKPGTHKVEIKKDGFSVEGKELTFKDGDKEVFTALLLPEKQDKPEKREAKADAPPVERPLPLPDVKKPDVQRKVRTTEAVKDESKDKAHPPLFEEEWIRETCALPAEQQWKAVAEKLKERNPGFNGAVKRTIEGESIIRLEFVTDYVTDISPLRALPKLAQLSCEGSGNNKGKLANLSPLKGMYLMALSCRWNNRISDLSPLKGMQLTELSCIGTSVSDLSPLKGMPLKTLAYDFQLERDSEMLRSIKTLLTINDKPVEEVLPSTETPKREARRLFLGHKGQVNVVAVTHNGKIGISGGIDSTVRVWDLATGNELRRFAGHKEQVWAVAVSPNDRYVVSGGGSLWKDDKWHVGEDFTLRLWNLDNAKESARSFSGHSAKITSVAYAPDGRHILSGSDDFTVRLWDVNTGREIRRFVAEGSVKSVAFSPDGRQALCAGLDKTIRLWNVATGEEPSTFAVPGHTECILGVVFSSDGRFVLSGALDKTVRLWNVRTGKEVSCFPSHPTGVLSVALSRDGRLALSGSGALLRDDGTTRYPGFDSTMRLWDVARRQEMGRFEGQSGGVMSIVFLPDGHQALSAGADGTVRLWQISAKQK